MVSYDFHISVHFEYTYRKTIESFGLISNEQTLQFSSANQEDMLNLHRVLKTKLNLEGFHDQFKAIKKIGQGSFATVNQFI